MCKGLFTPSDSVTITNVTLTGKMGMQTILPSTASVNKIKVVTCQCYGDGDGVVRCEQTLSEDNKTVMTVTGSFTSDP